MLLHKVTSFMLLAGLVWAVLEGGVQEATVEEQTGDMEGKVISLTIDQSSHVSINTDSWKVKVPTQLRKY